MQANPANTATTPIEALPAVAKPIDETGGDKHLATMRNGHGRAWQQAQIQSSELTAFAASGHHGLQMATLEQAMGQASIGTATQVGSGVATGAEAGAADTTILPPNMTGYMSTMGPLADINGNNSAVDSNKMVHRDFRSFASGEGGEQEYKLFVGMLPKLTREEDIREVFSKYGTIKEIFIMKGHASVTKGCAFLKYAKEEEAQRAIENLHNKVRILGSRAKLVVKFADSKHIKQQKQLHRRFRHQHQQQQHQQKYFQHQRQRQQAHGGMVMSSDFQRDNIGNIGSHPAIHHNNEAHYHQHQHGVYYYGDNIPYFNDRYYAAGDMATYVPVAQHPQAQLQDPGLPKFGDGIGNGSSQVASPPLKSQLLPHGQLGQKPQGLQHGQPQQQQQQQQLHLPHLKPSQSPPIPSIATSPGGGVVTPSHAPQSPTTGGEVQMQPSPSTAKAEFGAEATTLASMQLNGHANYGMYGTNMYYVPQAGSFGNGDGNQMIVHPAAGYTMYAPMGGHPHSAAVQMGGVMYDYMPGASNVSGMEAGSQEAILAQSYQQFYEDMMHGDARQFDGSFAIDEAMSERIRKYGREGPPGCNLFIYHLPGHFGDEDLYYLFERAGPIVSCRVFLDRETGESKGFGFVSYENPQDSHRAINMLNGYQIGNKRLKVQLKRSKKGPIQTSNGGRGRGVQRSPAQLSQKSGDSRDSKEDHNSAAKVLTADADDQKRANCTSESR